MSAIVDQPALRHTTPLDSSDHAQAPVSEQRSAPAQPAHKTSLGTPLLHLSANPFMTRGKDHALTLARPALLQQLEDLLNDGRSVVLCGPEGVGKTRLAREFFRQYLARKALSPHIFCVRLELDPAARTADILLAMRHRFREELERRGLLYEGVLPSVTRRKATSDSLQEDFQALSHAFEIMKEEGCEMVWFLDPLTPELSRRLEPILSFLEPYRRDFARVCVCLRSREHVPAVWQDAIRENELEVLEVPQFSRREVWRYLLNALKGRMPNASRVVTREVVSRLFVESGGNPMRLKAAAAQWVSEGQPGPDAKMPHASLLLSLLCFFLATGCATFSGSSQSAAGNSGNVNRVSSAGEGAGGATGGGSSTDKSAAHGPGKASDKSVGKAVGGEATAKASVQTHRDPALPAQVVVTPYNPNQIKQVALVPVKDFTPSDGVRVQIEEPLTSTLIRTLREDRGMDVLPGFLPNARSFQSALRAYVQGTRGSKFPTADFRALRTAVPAQSYLVYWIERSSRELIVNESRESVPGLTYSLQTVAVLLDPQGRVYWRTPFKGEHLGDNAQAMSKAYQGAADAAARTLVQAFDLPSQPVASRTASDAALTPPLEPPGSVGVITSDKGSTDASPERATDEPAAIGSGSGGEAFDKAGGPDASGVVGPDSGE